MKIVQIMATSGGGLGGLEQHTFNLVNALAEEHEVHFIALDVYAKQVHSKVHFHAFDFARSRLNPLLWWQLARLIQQIQPDIVHAQAGKAAELIKRIRSYLPKQAKVVTTVHGTKKNKAIYAHADAVIAVSSALTAGIPEHKAHVIYNGVHPQPNLTATQAQALKAQVLAQHPALDPSQKTVICIGRLEPVKNIALLIQAMQGIHANLWIVGDGSLRTALEQQVKDLNMSQQVAFLGFRSDARDLLQLADVVALSSEREGFPLVMVEALQAEKIMVSTKVNGVVEWLPTEALADLNDMQGLQQALKTALATNPQQAQHWATLFKRAQQQLTVGSMAQQTAALYQQLLVQ